MRIITVDSELERRRKFMFFSGKVAPHKSERCCNFEITWSKIKVKENENVKIVLDAYFCPSVCLNWRPAESSNLVAAKPLL